MGLPQPHTPCRLLCWEKGLDVQTATTSPSSGIPVRRRGGRAGPHLGGCGYKCRLAGKMAATPRSWDLGQVRGNLPPCTRGGKEQSGDLPPSPSSSPSWWRGESFISIVIPQGEGRSWAVQGSSLAQPFPCRALERGRGVPGCFYFKFTLGVASWQRQAGAFVAAPAGTLASLQQ